MSHPVPRPVGPPPWIGKLASDATLEGAVLQQAVHGRDNILALIAHARSLYEFQDYTYYGSSGGDFFKESYRSSVNGLAIECSIIVRLNEAGEADSVLIHYYPLGGALGLSRLVGRKFGERFGELYRAAAQAEAGAGAAAQPAPAALPFRPISTPVGAADTAPPGSRLNHSPLI